MPRGHPINYKDPKYIGMYFGTDVYEGFIEKDKHRTPMVQIRCTLCNTARKVDGSALFRGDKKHLSECSCKSEEKYKEHIGELFDSDMLISIGGRIDGQIGAKVKCIFCGVERDIPASALLREVGKYRKKSYKKCECLTHRFDYEYRVGDLFGTDILESFDGEKDHRGYYLVNVECTLCGRHRKVIGSALVSQNKGSLKQCVCVERDYHKHSTNFDKLRIPIKYIELKGKTIGDDKITDVFRAEDRNIFVVLECQKCGETRTIKASRFLNPNYHSLQCSCKKELGYYKSFIGKQIGDDLILSLADRVRFVFTYNVECQCCGRKRVVKAAKLLKLSPHLNKCDCKKRAYIHHKEDFIGKYYGLLLIKDLVNKNRQTYAICDCKCGNKNIEKPLSQLIAGDILSCGCISSSFGEMAISQILIDSGVVFSREQIFNDLLSPKNAYLRFDFAIWKSNSIVCLIEFDGLQHVDINHQIGVKNRDEAYLRLKTIQYYDRIKDKYAKDKNIPLYRISYTKNYDEIEKKILNILKVYFK